MSLFDLLLRWLHNNTFVSADIPVVIIVVGTVSFIHQCDFGKEPPITCLRPQALPLCLISSFVALFMCRFQSEREDSANPLDLLIPTNSYKTPVEFPMLYRNFWYWWSRHWQNFELSSSAIVNCFIERAKWFQKKVMRDSILFRIFRITADWWSMSSHFWRTSMRKIVTRRLGTQKCCQERFEVYKTIYFFQRKFGSGRQGAAYYENLVYLKTPQRVFLPNDSHSWH